MAFDPAGHVEMIDIEMHAALGSFGCEPLPGSAAEEEETGEAAEFALDDEALSEASLNTLTDAEADAQARREGLCLVRNPQVESGFTGVRTCVDGAGQKVYQATRRCLDARSSKTRRHDGDYFTYPAQAALQYARWVGPQGWVGPAQVVSTPLPDAVVKHVGAALAIAKAANEGLTLELAPGTSTGYRGVKCAAFSLPLLRRFNRCRSRSPRPYGVRQAPNCEKQARAEPIPGAREGGTEVSRLQVPGLVRHS